jgi:CTP:molybdopterin cytidylyltransferase MocA
VNERRDHAVILARGESRRMGRPKGLCPSGRPGLTCLQAVAALYREAGWPLAVVTTAPLAGLYAPLLADGPPVAWIEREPGADTAASVASALAALGDAATHLWLHPVDLPGVAPRTVARLLAASRAEPAAAWRPVHADAPGHPVVLPAAALRGLGGSWPKGPMRALLAAAAAAGQLVLRELASDDPGTVADRDTPADLAGPDQPEDDR